jgi:glutathione S-transferase
MLTIWGRLSSVNVQKVVWCADELGLQYERHDAGGKFGVNNTPGYLAKNPNAVVPTIEEDGFVLYESNAIVRYLAGRDPQARFWPKDLRERADADRWMEWQSTMYTPAMTAIFWQLIRTPQDQRDAKAVEVSRAKCERFTGILDAHLARNEWLAAGRFTAADIVVGCAVHRWLLLPIEHEECPNVRRWYETLKARPASHQVTLQPLS